MARVRTFSQGGLTVDSCRASVTGRPIRPLFFPPLAVVPLAQYPGARAEWLVNKGDSVREDQLLARGTRPEDLPLHSPVPGTVVDFREMTLPGGIVSSTALIRFEGEFDRTAKPSESADWAMLSSADLRSRLEKAGVCWSSSSLDAAPVLANLPGHLEALVVNGLQSEPYLAAPSILLEQRSQDLLEGIRILQKIWQPKITHLAVDPEHPDVWQDRFRSLSDGIHVHLLEFKYPQAQEGLLLRTLGFSPVQANRTKVLTVDVETVLALRDAVVEGKPQVEKSVVVAGKGVRNPGIYRVRIGTPIYQLLKDAGGLHPGDFRIVSGGPFLGALVDDLTVPVVKSTSAILALGKGEINSARERPCVRCGDCATHCPVGLEPLNLSKALQKGDWMLAHQEGLDLCIECGICSFICPSRIPLVSMFRKAKESSNAR